MPLVSILVGLGTCVKALFNPARAAKSTTVLMEEMASAYERATVRITEARIVEDGNKV